MLKSCDVPRERRTSKRTATRELPVKWNGGREICGEFKRVRESSREFERESSRERVRESSREFERERERRTRQSKNRTAPPGDTYPSERVQGERKTNDGSRMFREVGPAHTQGGKHMHSNHQRGYQREARLQQHVLEHRRRSTYNMQLGHGCASVQRSRAFTTGQLWSITLRLGSSTEIKAMIC
jgi:hypothetical protein